MREKVDKRRLLADFKALLRLERPFIDRSLYHKIEELKFTLCSDIDEKNQSEALKHNTGFLTDINSSLEAIEFEIYKIGSIWVPLIPDMIDINPFTVLPLPLIDYIVERVEEGIIGFNQSVQVKNHPPVKISFQKDSDSVIKGTIEKFENPPKTSIDYQVELIEQDSTKQDDLHTFLEYLLSPGNQGFSSYMLREFIVKWKPLIDGGCIEFPGKLRRCNEIK